jgi:hypothetical protein
MRRVRNRAAVRTRLTSLFPAAWLEVSAAALSLPSIAGSEPPTEIATLRGLRCSGLGIVTSSTPRSKLARTAAASTPSGRVSEREKPPEARSSPTHA